MPARRIPSYRRQKARNFSVTRIDSKDFCLGKHYSPKSHQKLRAAYRRDRLRRQDHGPVRVCELTAAYVTFARVYYVKSNPPLANWAACRSAEARRRGRIYRPSATLG